MIAIEGPDGAGKSTLASDLGEALNRVVYHAGGPATTVDEFRLRVTLQERQENVIHDRLMVVSEPIYATILQRPIAFETTAHADYYLRNLRSPLYIVYCRLSSINEMFENISKERKEHKSEEHIASMRRNYLNIVNAYDDRIIELSKPDYPMVVPIMFNWYVHDITDVMEKIKELRV